MTAHRLEFASQLHPIALQQEGIAQKVSPPLLRREVQVTFGLTPEYILARNELGQLINTRFEDVTDNHTLKAKVLQTVAEYYHELQDPKNPNGLMTVEQVSAMLCRDLNEQAERVNILTALTKLPDGSDAILSSMRFVWGCDNCAEGLLPIDEMGLIDVPGGWPNEREEKPYATVATVGRYFVAKEARSPVMRHAQIPGFLTGQLLHLGFEIGKRRHIPVEFFAAIMPTRVTTIVESGGVGVKELPMRLKLLGDNPPGTVFTKEQIEMLVATAPDAAAGRDILNRVEANKYYNQFGRYWMQPVSGDPPKLYQFLTG